MHKRGRECSCTFFCVYAPQRLIFMDTQGRRVSRRERRGEGIPGHSFQASPLMQLAKHDITRTKPVSRSLDSPKSTRLPSNCRKVAVSKIPSLLEKSKKTTSTWEEGGGGRQGCPHFSVDVRNHEYIWDPQKGGGKGPSSPRRSVPAGQSVPRWLLQRLHA